MTSGESNLRAFWITLAALWAVAAAGGVVYGRMLGLPASVLAPVLAACLLEISLYVLPGFESASKAVRARWSEPALAVGMAASAAAPYCLYAVPTGTFGWTNLGLLMSLASAAAFCYLWLPRNGYTDALFLAFMAAVVLSGCFNSIYPMPAPRLRLDILGQMMWTRTGVCAMLWFRRAEGIGFGFLPSRRDWSVGLRHYLYFLPVGLPLGLMIGFVRFRALPLPWWQAVGVALGTFLGMLWVVALAEEFFFRGVMQQGLAQRLGIPAAIVATSVAFGLVHLPFRVFPNWKFALVAAVAGLFYGRAYAQAGSIRAAMIVHALVNTTTRLFFPYA